MNLKEKRAEAMRKAAAYNERIKAGDTLSDDDTAALKELLAQIDQFDQDIKKANEQAELVSKIGALATEESETGNDTTDSADEGAKSLGDYFVKSVGAKLKASRGVSNVTISAPEYEVKAASTPITTGGTAGPLAALLTQVDQNVVTAYRRPTVSSLFGTGSMTSSALTYFVEGVREGNFSTVAEGGKKPQLSYANPTSVTEALKKIAGHIRVSDEMIEDLPFLVSEINGRLIYDLSLVEEAQLLNGDGTGSNVRGLLLRDGIQTIESAKKTEDMNSLFRARTLIEESTGRVPDGIIINPTDYQEMRLSTDANGQYYAGGPFTGSYGNGGTPQDPPLWGISTVVSAAVPTGTAIVGAFKQGATVYRKGGIRVESTNSNGTDFIENMVTIRAEERLALAVRIPQAFVTVNFSTAVEEPAA